MVTEKILDIVSADLLLSLNAEGNSFFTIAKA